MTRFFYARYFSNSIYFSENFIILNGLSSYIFTQSFFYDL
jgi:hypothetical protein